MIICFPSLERSFNNLKTSNWALICKWVSTSSNTYTRSFLSFLCLKMASVVRLLVPSPIFSSSICWLFVFNSSTLILRLSLGSLVTIGFISLKSGRNSFNCAFSSCAFSLVNWSFLKFSMYSSMYWLMVFPSIL